VNDIEENLLSNFEALESKYTLLKDQMAKFNKIYEEEIFSKEKLKSRNNEEFKSMEIKIKAMFSEFKEQNKNYIEDIFKKFENKLTIFVQNSKQDKDNFNSELNSIKESLNVF